METMYCRLKKYDPRRGHVLRRYTYRGIKFHEERGWYRVDKPTSEYLRTVRQVLSDEHSPLAFDVCTEAEAKAMDEKEKEEGAVRKSAADNIRLSLPREVDALTSDDLPETAKEKNAGNKGKKG